MAQSAQSALALNVSPLEVQFHGATLLVVEHNEQPYVPMRPIVDGMGMDWASQFTKLKTSRFSATVVETTMVAQDGKQRDMVCLPLRKLPGWLATISPNKVKPELREKVIAYQNEADDILWQAWQQGTDSARQLEVASIDPAALLLEGNTTPTVALPPEIERAVTDKAWELTREAHMLIGEHLRRRVAMRAEVGHPRTVDASFALRAISGYTLGEALAHTYAGQVEAIISHAETIAYIANETAKKMKAATH